MGRASGGEGTPELRETGGRGGAERDKDRERDRERKERENVMEEETTGGPEQRGG